jgi:hypothetical protein
VSVCLTLAMSVQDAAVALDPTCALALAEEGKHQLAVVVDAGPQLVMWLVDGTLCDGGISQTRGWTWLPSGLGDLGSHGSGAGTLHVGEGYGGKVLGGRLYGRALRNSEVVGNFRAGL